MIGLRRYARDPLLPALCGDAQLVAPAPAEVVELVNAHLLLPGASAATSNFQTGVWRGATANTR